MTDLISRRDIAFNLHAVHGLDEVLSWPSYAEHDAASADAILDAAFTLAHEVFLPSAAKLDAEEPHFDGERVHQPAECGEAQRAFIEAGFLAAPFPAEDGGLGLPALVSTAMGPVFSATNTGANGYLFLTQAAANLIRVHGSAEQKARYMAPLIAGRWFGTMCLSEPQAGSSLADIKTRATPLADGRYAVSGNKMWISGGDHELTENIVHLVLARIEGAPAGVKGISLFIVPKRRIGEDGTVAGRNGVRLIGLNHKLGHRGVTNCALAFGDGGESLGELVGEPHRGLQYMFHMMNEARIGVGMGAVALGYAGYRYSLDYAKGRQQGRPVASKNPQAAPVPIVEHADVRRMLLLQKAYVEGGLCLGLFGARLLDEQQAHPEPARRQEAHALLDLLTPIIKSWPSEWCLEANKLAIQVLGGYGYTRDYPVERWYRDNRLNHIHEGTNGIQGLDLLGRKVLGDGGRSLAALLVRVQRTVDEAAGSAASAGFGRALSAAVARVQSVTEALKRATVAGPLEPVLAHANAYLELLGHTVVGWLWLRQALCAESAGGSSDEDRQFHAGKRAACRAFYDYELPKTEAWARLLLERSDVLLSLDVQSL